MNKSLTWRMQLLKQMLGNALESRLITLLELLEQKHPHKRSSSIDTSL